MVPAGLGILSAACAHSLAPLPYSALTRRTIHNRIGVINAAHQDADLPLPAAGAARRQLAFLVAFPMVPGVSNAPNHVVGAASAQRSAGASNCAKLRPAGHAGLAVEGKSVGDPTSHLFATRRDLLADCNASSACSRPWASMECLKSQIVSGCAVIQDLTASGDRTGESIRGLPVVDQPGAVAHRWHSSLFYLVDDRVTPVKIYSNIGFRGLK